MYTADIQYWDGSAWLSATAAVSSKALRASSTLRLAVDKDTPFVGIPTLDPTLVLFTPAAPATQAGSTAYGFTFASALNSASTASTAYYDITGTGAWAGTFAVSLDALAITVSGSDASDPDSDAMSVGTGSLSAGFVVTGGVFSAAAGGSSLAGVPQAAGSLSTYLRLSYASGVINGAGRFDYTTSLATTDLTLDPTKVSIKDASNHVYTLEQAGLSIASSNADGVVGNAAASWRISISNTRMGGVFSVSLADGALCNTDSSWCSAAVSNVVTNLQVRGGEVEAGGAEGWRVGLMAQGGAGA